MVARDVNDVGAVFSLAQQAPYDVPMLLREVFGEPDFPKIQYIAQEVEVVGAEGVKEGE